MQATTTAAVTPSVRPTVMLAKRSFIVTGTEMADDGTRLAPSTLTTVNTTDELSGST